MRSHRICSGGQLTIKPEKDPTPQRLPTNDATNREPTTGDSKTIKKGPGGPVVSTLGNDINRWKAVKDAIG